MVASLLGSDLITSKMRAGSGNSGPAVHFALLISASRALIACSSRAATTPRNEPSRTTAITPGIAFTAASSTLSSFEP